MMDCIVLPKKGNQVGFPRTIDAYRILPNFINLKKAPFFFIFFFLNLQLSLFHWQANTTSPWPSTW